MKKLLFLFLLSFAISFCAKAQPYHRFLENDKWYELVSTNTGPFHYWYVKAWDTLITSTAYKIIRLNTGGHQYYVREDTVAKQVFIKTSPAAPEVLNYDFSLLPGALFTYLGVTFRLDSIVPVNTFLGARNEFYYHDTANSSFQRQCIEGIGSIQDPMFFARFRTDPVWNLVCSYVSS